MLRRSRAARGDPCDGRGRHGKSRRRRSWRRGCGRNAGLRKDGRCCPFQSSEKFKTRYAELGFSDQAKLDDGALWPVAYALTELGKAEEVTITALVKKAAG